MNSRDFTDLERDALKETANVGAGNASIALAEVVHKTVNLTVSDVDLLPISQANKFIAGPQRLVVGIYTPILEGMTGNMVMTLEKESAMLLADEILKIKSRTEDILTDKDQKTLQTVGNIISEFYLKSLNQFLDLSLGFKDTSIVVTFGESIMDIITVSLDPTAEEVLLINTDFSIEDTSIKGKFMLLLAVKSIDTLILALRKKFA